MLLGYPLKFKCSAPSSDLARDTTPEEEQKTDSSRASMASGIRLEKLKKNVMEQGGKKSINIRLHLDHSVVYISFTSILTREMALLG